MEPVVEACKKDVKGFENINTEALIKCWESSIPSGVGFAYGAMKDGKAIGFLLGVNMFSPLSNEKEAAEYLFMMVPEHRGNGTAKQLLDEFERGAEKDGCSATLLGCSVFYKPEALGRKYAGRGYGKVLESWRKRL